MGCVNSKLMVVDALSGRVVTELAIGRGSDAIAFDSKRRRVFSSNGLDGTVTVHQQRTPDTYEALAPIELDELQGLIGTDAVLVLDVREPHERDEG